MFSDDVPILIVDADPGRLFEEDLTDPEDDCLSLEWEESHKISEIDGEAKRDFFVAALEMLKECLKDQESNKEKLGGIFETEIAEYMSRIS